MVINPNDFLEHSERIKEKFDDEIARRCAISRGYYYAFHFVHEIGKNHPKSNFQNGSGDKGEAEKFLERIGQKDIADKLQDLRNQRNDADYELDIEIDERDFGKFKQDIEQFKRKMQFQFY